MTVGQIRTVYLLQLGVNDSAFGAADGRRLRDVGIGEDTARNFLTGHACGSEDGNVVQCFYTGSLMFDDFRRPSFVVALSHSP